jgi:hypothetical protein
MQTSFNWSIRITAGSRKDGRSRVDTWIFSLSTLALSGRRIVVDVLMRRRGQTGRPRSVRLSNTCLKKARRRAFR